MLVSLSNDLQVCPLSELHSKPWIRSQLSLYGLAVHSILLRHLTFKFIFPHLFFYVLDTLISKLTIYFWFFLDLHQLPYFQFPFVPLTGFSFSELKILISSPSAEIACLLILLTLCIFIRFPFSTLSQTSCNEESSLSSLLTFSYFSLIPQFSTICFHPIEYITSPYPSFALISLPYRAVRLDTIDTQLFLKFPPCPHWIL